MQFLREAWVVIQAVAKILNYSRFSLIIVLITVFSLETIGQIKDILVGLGPLGSNLKVVFFVLAVNWLAFQSWGWARFIYNRVYTVENGQRGEAGYQRQLIDWLPRIYAAATFFAAYRAAIRAHVDGIAYSIVAVGLLVLLFLVYRRDIAIKMQAFLYRISDSLPFVFTIIVMTISTVYAIWSPVSFGNLLGAGSVVFLGLGSIIPVGTGLVYAASENRFPVVIALVLLAVLFSPFNDNHQVRRIEGQVSDTQSHTLTESLNRWMHQRVSEKPMILVATAGGGLRASYWTGAILGRFQSRFPDFNNQLFAVSGVSGGSVGAVFYNGALASNDCLPEGAIPTCFEDKLLESIGQDYLAATAASMLYGDLIQRFLPFPVFRDRAEALERSWEVGFARTYPASVCGLDKSFTSFYEKTECGEIWQPQLLINGTYEESGRRMLTTSFAVKPTTFLDTHDFYELNNQKAIRASTAALNSARFSYISPAGTFGKDVGHIIDGGYFENYGANTLTNLIDWLHNEPSNPLSNGLIVIVISNDSTTPFAQYDLSAIPATAPAQNMLNEVLAPVLGLVNTRSGHGMLAYKQLLQYTEQLEIVPDPPSTAPVNVDFVHFYINATQERPSPPLGWILSEESKKDMKDQVMQGKNCLAYRKVMSKLDAADDEECLVSPIP